MTTSRITRTALVACTLATCMAGPALATPTAPPDASTRSTHDGAQRDRWLLSSLWAFASLNYLYCDVVGLMDAHMLRQYSAGEVDGVRISENFLFGATIMMQVPLSMVFLSALLPPRASRIANISAGALMTAVQTATLFVGSPTKYYALSSGIEIATTGFITAYALFAMKPPRVTPVVDARADGLTVGAALRF